MTEVIVAGHAGYGTSVKNSMSMVMGETSGFHFIDFDADDGVDLLEKKFDEAIRQCGGNEILFACDLRGGSPFKTAAVRSAENETYRTVAGINLSAYAEVLNNLNLSAEELARMAVDVTKETVCQFPEES